MVSAGVTAIGLWAREANIRPGDREILMRVVVDHLPRGLGLFVALGLLSAVFSSADTCLLTVSSIVENDLRRKRKVGETRVIILGMCLISLVLAWMKRDIIPHLLLAYHVFNCGVIPPLALALLRRNRRLHRGLVLSAIAAGGTLGVAASLTSRNGLALLGIGASFLLSLAALAAGDSAVPERRDDSPPLSAENMR